MPGTAVAIVAGLSAGLSIAQDQGAAAATTTTTTGFFEHAYHNDVNMLASGGVFKGKDMIFAQFQYNFSLL